MKTAVMTEEKLAREDEIDKVKDTVKEVYAEKFAGHEEEAQFLKEVKQIAEDLEKMWFANRSPSTRFVRMAVN